MNTRERTAPLWENLEWIVILLIVIGHFADQGGDAHGYHSVFLFLYSFHMPLLCFVFGLFHSDKNIGRRITVYLLLYLLMKVLIYGERLLLGQKPSFTLLKESGVPWLMFALAAFTLMTYFFRLIDKRFLLVCSVILACAAGYFSSIGDVLVLSRILVFYPFYLAGCIIPKDKLEGLRQQKWAKWAAAFLLLAWAAACFFLVDQLYFLRPLLTGRNPFAKSLWPFGALWRLLCYALSSVLGMAVILLAPSKKILLTGLGRRALPVYFWHRMVLYLLQYFGLPAYFISSRPLQLAWLGLSVPVALVLSAYPFRFPAELILRLSKNGGKSGAQGAAEADGLISPGESSAAPEVEGPLLFLEDDEPAKGKIAVKVDDVSMKFSLSSEKVDSLKDYVIGTVTGKKMERDEFWALKHVSFTLKKGDRLGILGLNGAGKSTLLKAIAGVYRPTEGSITKHGVIAPLLELGAGFDMQYTARENIYLYGAVLGYKRKFIESKFDEIIRFAELEKFVDVPLKNYSSGMKSRLGFAICTAVEPDILILDEVLSVGDAKFRRKSEKRIMDMFEHNVTVLFVSHSIDQVETICNKAIILDHGEVRAYGNIKEVAALYREMTE